MNSHHHLNLVALVVDKLTDANHRFLSHITCSTLNRSVARHAVNGAHVLHVRSFACPCRKLADTLVRFHRADVAILLAEVGVAVKELLDSREHLEVLIDELLSFFNVDVQSVSQLVRTHAVGKAEVDTLDCRAQLLVCFAVTLFFGCCVCTVRLCSLRPLVAVH